MIIDIHTHIAFHKLYPSRYIEGMLLSEAGLQSAGVNTLVKAFMNDLNCSKMLKQMDAAGIDKAVLLIIDGGIGLGEAEMSIDEIYAAHYNVLSRHHERFIVFAGIDPRRGEYGFSLFKKGIEEYGFKGLKLYPPMGYAMDHEQLHPYYKFCKEKRLPVLLHTGPSLPFMENHWADVENINSIAGLYPGVNFILAHAGCRIDKDIIQLLKKYANVYLDISGYQAIYAQDVEKAKKQLRLIFQSDLSLKVLFGSDWPLFNLVNSLKKNIEYIESMERFSNDDDVFSSKALAMVMGGNAAKVLGLE